MSRISDFKTRFKQVEGLVKIPFPSDEPGFILHVRQIVPEEINGITARALRIARRINEEQSNTGDDADAVISLVFNREMVRAIAERIEKYEDLDAKQTVEPTKQEREDIVDAWSYVLQLQLITAYDLAVAGHKDAKKNSPTKRKKK